MTSVMTPDFAVTLAATPEEIAEAQRLRYDVFVRELGGTGAAVDHAAGREVDRFDPHADHLLLRDMTRGAPGQGEVVGVYRLMRADQAARAGGFYSAAEYDLEPLLGSGRRLLELGRSCLHPEYRGGAAMMHLWQALAAYVARHRCEILFGVASFHGTDPRKLVHPLSLLQSRHLAPPELRVHSRNRPEMVLLPPDRIDRRRAMLETPALIKAYLRLGGVVGDGAFVDHAFNTTDICMIMDTAALSRRARSLYAGGARP